MHTLPTLGVSNGGSIAADVPLGGEVLLRNSLAIADDKENLLPDAKQAQTSAISQSWPEAGSKAMLQ